MKKTLILGTVLILAGVLLLLAPGFGQSAATPPGKFISSEQWKKMIDDDKPRLGMVAGQTAQILPQETWVIRRRMAGPNNASVHSKEVDGAAFSEVYYIIEGTGEFITGGSYDPKNRTAGITGGEKNSFKPGDVIVIPMGTAHWFAKINGRVTYIQTRYPGNVMETRKP
jgi:mannose-6-phosphate isomerase-like protein (cupin superfamily)